MKKSKPKIVSKDLADLEGVKKTILSESKRKYHYNIVNGKRVRKYNRNKKSTPRKPYTKSTYNKFNSQLSSYLKDENIDYKLYGNTYQEALSVLWKKTKETYPEKDALDLAVSNFDYSIVPILTIGTTSDKLEFIDALDGSNWWELSESLAEIPFSNKDKVEFVISEEYHNYIHNYNDLTKNTQRVDLMNTLNHLIVSRNYKRDESEVLKIKGVPSSSDLRVSIDYKHNEKDDSIRLIITIPDLPIYLDYQYKGKTPTQRAESKQQESTPKTSETTKQDLNLEISLINAKAKLFEEQNKLIQNLKDLGLTPEEIRNKLGL